jgi:hypothetical protein
MDNEPKTTVTESYVCGGEAFSLASSENLVLEFLTHHMNFVASSSYGTHKCMVHCSGKVLDLALLEMKFAFFHSLYEFCWLWLSWQYDLMYNTRLDKCCPNPLHPCIIWSNIPNEPNSSNHMSMHVWCPCMCISNICTNVHAHVHESLWTVIMLPWGATRGEIWMFFDLRLYCPCLVATLVPCLPPPPTIPHYTHLLHL